MCDPSLRVMSLCLVAPRCRWVTSPEVAKYVPPLKLLTEVSKFCLKTACNVLREDISYVDFSEIIDFSKFLYLKDFANSGTSESIQPEEVTISTKKKQANFVSFLAKKNKWQ